MGTSDYLTDIAVTLDSFFKGLSDCGLLTTYTVELQFRVIDLTLKQKFSLVVNEFMANLRILLLKVSKSSDDDFVHGSSKEDMFPLLELMSQELNRSDIMDLLSEDTTNENENEMPKKDELPVLSDHYFDSLLTQIDTSAYETKSCNDINVICDVQHSDPVVNPSSRVSNLFESASVLTEPSKKIRKRSRSKNILENTEVTEAITKYRNDNGWQCDTCNQVFSSLSRLQEHFRGEHSGRGCFECHFCGLRVGQKNSLIRHIKRHLGKNEGTCSICGHSFSRLDNLASHYKKHIGQPLYPCTICNKKCINKSQLAIHEKTHNKNRKQYVCHQCDKSFTRKDKLKEHIVRHLKIKRFQCSICGKSYVEKRSLRSHLELHDLILV